MSRYPHYYRRESDWKVTISVLPSSCTLRITRRTIGVDSDKVVVYRGRRRTENQADLKRFWSLLDALHLRNRHRASHSVAIAMVLLAIRSNALPDRFEQAFTDEADDGEETTHKGQGERVDCAPWANHALSPVFLMRRRGGGRVFHEAPVNFVVKVAQAVLDQMRGLSTFTNVSLVTI